jgi:hypothetical protein
MVTYPPKVKTFTADNATGAEIVPVSTCRRIEIFENALAGTDDYSITIGAYTVTHSAATPAEFTKAHGGVFDEGIGTGITIKRATAGSLTFAQEEHGQ